MPRHTFTRPPTLLVIAVIVAMGISIVTFKLISKHNSMNRTTISKAENNSKKSMSHSDQAKTAYIRLPGADPIAAIPGNYKQSDSLWVVVSKEYPLLDSKYIPSSLAKPMVPTNTDKSEDEQNVRIDITKQVETMFAEAKSSGFELMVASGYRSYELQQTYFSNYSAQYGEVAANNFSAKPGQSEHQTGLSLDISLVSKVCYLDTCFGETEAGKWLAKNAVNYGFVLRYPADKTATTKYQYEPWHFRYVGKSLATALSQSGLTLDEAYPYLAGSQVDQ